MPTRNDEPDVDRLTAALRALAAVSFMALIVFLVLQDQHDISLIALLIGSLALWLGYEGVVLPFIRRRR